MCRAIEKASVIGLGALVLGAVLMLIQRAMQGSWFTNADIPVEAAGQGPERAGTAAVAVGAE